MKNNWIWQRADWPVWEYVVSEPTIRQLLKIYKLTEERNGNTIHTDVSRLQSEEAIRSLAREARATSAIEGEHLSYGDLHSAATSLLRAGHPVDPNIDEGATSVVQMLISSRRNIHEPLTRDWLHGLHQQLLGYLEQDKRYQGQIGKYRCGGVVIGDGQRILYEAPPPERVESLMASFIEWYNRPFQLPFGSAPALSGQDLDNPVLLAPVKSALAHLWFERIHPFIDGNGRIGRALSEQILLQANLPDMQLSQTIEIQRQSYYRELNRYGKDHQGNNISGWIDWFTAMVHKAIVREMAAEREMEY